jgi:hypothetical protein
LWTSSLTTSNRPSCQPVTISDGGRRRFRKERL